jgi:hypothetical protein
MEVWTLMANIMSSIPARIRVTSMTSPFFLPPGYGHGMFSPVFSYSFVLSTKALRLPTVDNTSVNENVLQS